MIVQVITVNEDEPIKKAAKYYALLSILYDLKLTPKEIELLAFTAIRGTITPPSAKQDFVKRFNTSEDSLNNFKSHLTTKGYLVKDNGQHRVHPKLLTDFTKPLTLKITLNGQDKGDDIEEGGRESKPPAGDS